MGASQGEGVMFIKSDGEGGEALPIGDYVLLEWVLDLRSHPTSLKISSAARRISRKIIPNFAS